MSLSTRILIGLGFGLLSGIAYSVFELPILRFLPGFIEPLGTLWVNAIRMTVIPLLMSLLVTAIAGQGSSGVVAQLGSKAICLFVIMIVAACLYTLVLAPVLLSLLDIDPTDSEALLAVNQTSDASRVKLPPFRDWLVNLVPANAFRAMVDNAVLPLMIFTGLFAASLLHIAEQQRSLVVSFFAAIKDTMFVLIRWVMWLAPIGIFALVFPLAATLGVTIINILGSFIVICCGMIVGMTLLLYPVAVILGRVPLQAFVKILAPVQVIGFSTRSSLAALPATFAATRALGVSENVAGVVLPIAVTLFKFASPIGRTAGTYFIAQLYGIELSTYELVVVAAAIGFFSFYSPGIPSGGLLIMTPVYASLGLPVSGIGILIAIDLFVDMFITAANVTANITAVTLLSRNER
ncbi:MAG: proton glutamate symport protein [Candidatus Azotimanducaceae bacterium]|jgi:proton glutamate symport protein